jgi:ABC-type transport system involved in cytochrome bd biosynthesis fused ATPase/permease subunit
MSKYLRVCFVLLFVVCTVVAVALWQGLYSFVFAWVLNFMLMLVVLFFTQTFKLKLESNYYHSKKWENGGKIYKWFGVHGYRKVLVWVGWEKLGKAVNPVKKSLDALKHLEYNTRQSEFGHLIIFFMVLVLTLFVGFYYGFKQSFWLLILNVILNAYPIVVQRFNRPRLLKAIHKIKSLSTGT